MATGTDTVCGGVVATFSTSYRSTAIPDYGQPEPAAVEVAAVRHTAYRSKVISDFGLVARYSSVRPAPCWLSPASARPFTAYLVPSVRGGLGSAMQSELPVSIRF